MLDLDDIPEFHRRVFATARAIAPGNTVTYGELARRLGTPGAARAVGQALAEEGCDVLELGRSGTEEMYFATTQFGADGGIGVAASHNPMDYNGMKMVRAGSAPLDAATGFERAPKTDQEKAALAVAEKALRDPALFLPLSLIHI